MKMKIALISLDGVDRHFCRQNECTEKIVDKFWSKMEKKHKEKFIEELSTFAAENVVIFILI